MRIIAGKAGRIAIKVPASVARPSTDFVRQAIFSILSARVENALVLDLFAGSGAIGLEALSRGARQCCFVDEHAQACAAIRHNLEKTRLEGGRVIKSAARRFLEGDPARYDLIFADPPYWKHAGDTDHLKELAPHVAAHLAADGWYLAECASHYQPAPVDGLELADRRSYGSSSILLYHHSPVA